MKKIITRFLLFLFVIMGFFGPFITIITLEKVKRENELLAAQDATTASQNAAAEARYQYYLDVTERKTNLQQAMLDSKTQYEQLIKEQPTLINDKKTTTTKTVIKPVATQKVVQQKVTASKPKASTKTKTS